jgi:transposase-like protein
MSNKRKQYSSQFRAKVTLEAIRSEKTVAELASQYEVHPTMISNWKRQLIEEASSLFERGNVSSRLKGSEVAIFDKVGKTAFNIRAFRCIFQ